MKQAAVKTETKRCESVVPVRAVTRLSKNPLIDSNQINILLALEGT